MNVKKLINIFKKGVIQVVMLTPMKENEEIDYDGLKENTKWLVEKSKNQPIVLTPVGSTGESYTLSDEEYYKAIKTVIDTANDKVPVVPGANHASTIGAIRRAKVAEDLGADGVLSVLPYYHVPQEEGLYQHYKKLADSINIGYEVYNNIDVSKIRITPELLKKLVDTTDNIIGIKENNPFIQTIYKEIKLVGDKIPVLEGRGEWWYAATTFIGINGYVSVIANFMPEVSLELLNAGKLKDYEKLKRIIEEKIDPLDEYIAKISKKYGPTTTVLPYPYMDNYMFYSVYKAIMDIVGLHGGRMRLPLLDLTEEDKNQLKKFVLEKLKAKKI